MLATAKLINMIDWNAKQDAYLIIQKRESKGRNGIIYNVIYAIDDERVLWVYGTGCGRGAKNACLSDKTFKKDVASAQMGIDYLKGCYFVPSFIAAMEIVKVSELKVLCIETYNLLQKDVEDFNNRIIQDKKRKEEEEINENRRYQELCASLRDGSFEDIEHLGNNEYRVIIRIKEKS